MFCIFFKGALEPMKRTIKFLNQNVARRKKKRKNAVQHLRLVQHPRNRLRSVKYFDSRPRQNDFLTALICLSGQEMAPTGQRPLLKDSWHHNNDYVE